MKHALVLLLLLVACLSAVAQEPPGPVLRTMLEKQAAIPGQPIILRVTLLVPTWLSKPPVFPSFEVPNAIVRLPPRSSSPTSARVGNETWSGVTRAYRLYPMTIGRFVLPPQKVIVTYADPATRKPVTTTLQSEEIVFAGTMPEGAENLDPFIAAETVTLEQTIEGEPGTLEAGSSVTRTVKVEVRGTPAIFLPPMIVPLNFDGLRGYPKEPVLIEVSDRGEVSGERLESVTYVAETGGRHLVPEISLRWYNLKTKQIETAKASGFEIIARGPAPRGVAFDWRWAALWLAISVLIIATFSAFAWRVWPPFVAWRRRRRDAYLASEAYAFVKAIAALRAHDIGVTIRAVELWASRLPPTRVSNGTRLADTLAALGADFYGRFAAPPSSERWSEATAALRDERRARISANAAARSRHGLPPLNPGKV